MAAASGILDVVIASTQNLSGPLVQAAQAVKQVCDLSYWSLVAGTASLGLGGGEDAANGSKQPVAAGPDRVGRRSGP